jgi:DNA-3-methyladenine glycosylase
MLNDKLSMVPKESRLANATRRREAVSNECGSESLAAESRLTQIGDDHVAAVADEQRRSRGTKEKIFTREFYARSTVTVARDLLGAVLCRRFADGRVVAAPIVEVEAYTEDDPACHAFRGITERCRVLFGQPGIAYVYFIYGMYNCLNVVTEPDGVPGAILIRALGAEGGAGPGKLCQTWEIDRSFNGVDLTCTESSLWIAQGERIASNVGETVRIGVTSAQDRIWRFYVKGNQYVSGPRKLGGGKRPLSKKKLPGSSKTIRETSKKATKSSGEQNESGCR